MLQDTNSLDNLLKEITFLKKELAESQDRCRKLEAKARILDAIMKYIPEGITVANAPDVNIQMVSEYGQLLVGKPKETILNIPHDEQPAKWNLYHRDGITIPESQELPLTRATLHGELVKDEEWIIRRPDGSNLTILCNAGPIYDENNQIMGGLIAWRDISDRKQNEQVLESHRRLLQTVVERTPAATNIIRGSDLRIILANDASRAIGPGKDVVGKTLDELWPETGRAFGELCRQVLTTGKSHHAVDEQFPIRRHPEGPLETAYFSWSLYRIDLPDQPEGGILYVAWETTEHVQTVKALLKAQEEAERRAAELDRILEALPVGVFLHDAQGNVTKFNQAAKDIWSGPIKVGSEDYREYKGWRLGSNKQLDSHEWGTARTIREGISTDEEVEIETFDRKKKVIRHLTVPVQDKNGDLFAAIAVNVDITNLKWAETVIQEGEQNLAAELQTARLLQQVSTKLILSNDIQSLYEQILDTSVAIMDADFASIQMFVTERGELRLLGHRGFNPRAATFWEWVRPGSESTCGIALRTGKRVIASDIGTCDFMAGSEDRETYLQAGIRAVQTTPLYSRSGDLLGMLSTHWRKPYEPSPRKLTAMDILARLAADLIERKRNEEAVYQAKEEAERANRAKSEFLANMSHEIRTPMNGILGMTQLVLMEEIPPRAREYLDLAQKSGQTLLEIINDILDLSKIEAGKTELEHEHFLLRSLVGSTVKPLALMAANKNLTFRHAVDVEVPDNLVGDAGRLRQVLTNIIGNAVKFTEAGKVTVTVKRADEPASSPDCVRLLFRVQDTGIGIPQDRQEHVFQSFSQAGGSAHVKYGGTGLGLTISKELVEMMGGSISVESEVEKGSVFSFYAELGLAERMQAQRPQEARTTQKSQPLKVLLVEDNVVNQTLAAEFLKRAGHVVVIAGNGKEALEELNRNTYDLVLMDIRMPEMNGEEAAKRIRGGEALDPNVPIVALTAHALKGDRERFMAAGMDDYLSKPINVEDLNQVLARVIDNRRTAK